MKWFGESWRAPVCEPDQQVGTPYGLPCCRCGQVFDPGDRGFVLPVGRLYSAYHRGCLAAEMGVPWRALGDVEDG